MQITLIAPLFAIWCGLWQQQAPCVGVSECCVLQNLTAHEARTAGACCCQTPHQMAMKVQAGSIYCVLQKLPHTLPPEEPCWFLCQVINTLPL